MVNLEIDVAIANDGFLNQPGSQSGSPRALGTQLAVLAYENGPGLGPSFSSLVPGGGIEPPLCCQNWILSPARLPIPPSRLWETSKIAHSARRRARLDIAHAM